MGQLIADIKFVSFFDARGGVKNDARQGIGIIPTLNYNRFSVWYYFDRHVKRQKDELYACNQLHNFGKRGSVVHSNRSLIPTYFLETYSYN